MAAALRSLTYTVDDGKDYNGTYFEDGSANVSDLSCYLHGDDRGVNRCNRPVTSDALAHAYGENTLGPDQGSPPECGNYSDTASIINSKQDFRYYCRRNTTIQEFAYRFKEYNPNDTQHVYPHFTTRIITASSGLCNEYQETSRDRDDPGHIGDDANGGVNYVSSVKFDYTNKAANRNGSINIPTSALGNDGTTYIFRGPEAPLNATKYACGDRCIWMWAYKNPSSPDSDDSGQVFYECPITVGTVTNMYNPKHNISDDTARQAA